MNNRPIGITILAVLGFISVAFYFVMTVLALVSRDQAANVLSAMTAGGAGPAPLQTLGAVLPFYFLITGLITLAMSWGFWKLKNWARIIALVLIGISVVAGGVGIAATSHSTTAATGSALVRLLVALFIFCYLCTARVRAAFRAAAAPNATT
jgi:hypothetical protein